MKRRNNPIRDDSYQESMEFEEVSYEGIEEYVEDDRYHFKKPLVVAVMAISIGLIASGVSNIPKEPEVYNAIEVEQSKWSDFDSTKIDSYFNILSSGSEYKMLDAMCTENSKVYSKIKSSEAKMVNLYDKFYGIAQAYQKFGSYMSISRINGVCDNKVSLTICCVTDDDITEFFNLYANDLNRYFTSHELSEENIVRELFNLLSSYEITTSEVSIELPVKKVDGVWIIANDSEIARLLQRAYMASVNDMVRQLNMHR